MSHALSIDVPPCPDCGAAAESCELQETTCIGSLGPHDFNTLSVVASCATHGPYVVRTRWRCSCGWAGKTEPTVVRWPRPPR